MPVCIYVLHPIQVFFVVWEDPFEVSKLSIRHLVTYCTSTRSGNLVGERRLLYIGACSPIDLVLRVRLWGGACAAMTPLTPLCRQRRGHTITGWFIHSPFLLAPLCQHQCRRHTHDYTGLHARKTFSLLLVSLVGISLSAAGVSGGECPYRPTPALRRQRTEASSTRAATALVKLRQGVFFLSSLQQSSHAEIGT